MDKKFTRFLSYADINAEDINLVEDAFLGDIDYGAISDILQMVEYEPSLEVVNRILNRI